MNIITNRIPRPLQCLYDLPPAAAKDFGYLGQAEACEPRLVQYKGVWYDVLDSMTCPGAVEPMPRAMRSQAGTGTSATRSSRASCSASRTKTT
jgi:hypothetical protein